MMGSTFSSETRSSSSDMDKDQKKSQEAPNSSVARPLSIEAPSQSSQQPEVMPNQPRQPRDLQGLLRFAMEATKSEDAPHQSHFQPMDEERKKFLEETLTSMTVNVIQEIQNYVKLLQNVYNLSDEDDPSQYEAALDRITEYCDNTDTANDFYKIGGFSIFAGCFNSLHSGIRAKAANLIAEITQNNPYCQDKIMEAGYIPILLGMVDNDPSDIVRVKSLYAISCIIRGHSVGLMHMEINDGYSVLIRALQSPIEKLQIKSAFLLSSLCTKDKQTDLRLTFIKMGLIEQAAGLLAMSSLLPETREQLLSVIHGLTSDNYYPALKECRRPELCLKQTLDRHLRESREEQDVDREQMCKEILDKVFADQGDDQER
ncbi:hypothetical protein TKK_0003332 [Trichogramma kaykai]